MLAIAAARMGLRCHIYADDAEAPAFDVAAAHTLAPFDDEGALEDFARAVDVATIEFENIPVPALATVAEIVDVHPGPEALAVTQDRLSEKEFLASLAIPVAPFQAVDSPEQLERALETVGVPALLKTRRLGYDGKGQVKIEHGRNIAAITGELGGQPLLLESLVAFERELSVVLARDRSGETRCYDAAENVHKDQILVETRVPARIPEATALSAKQMAEQIAAGLDIVGVVCVEFFDCGAGAATPLMVNEIAPRVHNSGHWTLDGCLVSQFENHIRAVAGWPLGPTERHSDAVMTNLIGDDVERWRDALGDPHTALHLYGKRQSRKGRKMGHVTRLLPKDSGG
jgi:5-(carboxyamino)imidazole ribonucleotide synthase